MGGRSAAVGDGRGDDGNLTELPGMSRLSDAWSCEARAVLTLARRWTADANDDFKK